MIYNDYFIRVSGSGIEFEGCHVLIDNSEKLVIVIRDRASEINCDYPVKENASSDLHNSIALKNCSHFVFYKVKKNLVVIRDWPGFDQVYYYTSDDKIEVSNNIKKLGQGRIEISSRGARQFISDRKHYHNNTIFKNVKLMHPGHSLSFSVAKRQVVLSSWYLPAIESVPMGYARARSTYERGIEKYLIDNIPNKNAFIALMFSGGSDSLYLLQTLVKNGYKRIKLYTCCVKGSRTQVEYANQSAKYFHMQVSEINISPEDALSEWLKYIENVHHCLSELRLDGMPIFLNKAYTRIVNDAGGDDPKVIWGSQYSVISPTTSTLGIGYLSIILLLYKFLKLLPQANKIKTTLIEKLLCRYPMFKKEVSDPDILAVYVKGAQNVFSNSKTVSCVVNYILLTNYNYLKHWWMDHRNRTSALVSVKISNYYPFHDRDFQEKIMEIPLSVRVGGIQNILRMPASYKMFFYSLLDFKIPRSNYAKGNYKSLDEFFSLFKSEKVYNYISDFYNLNRATVSDVFGSTYDFNYSFSEFKNMSTEEVEKHFGVIFVCYKSNRIILPNLPVANTR